MCVSVLKWQFNIMLFVIKIDVEVLTYLMWGRVHIT